MEHYKHVMFIYVFRVRKEDETILAEYWSFSKQWMMKIILGFNGSFDLKIQ